MAELIYWRFLYCLKVVGKVLWVVGGAIVKVLWMILKPLVIKLKDWSKDQMQQVSKK